MPLIHKRLVVASIFSHKVYIMRLLLLVLVMLITPIALSENYTSKADPIDYKCVPHKEVGINWDGDGDDHKISTFQSNDHDIFFLTHHSNVPAEVANTIQTPQDISWTDTVVYERNSYYFRKANQDPKNNVTYYTSLSCNYFEDESSQSIECGNKSKGAFEFNLKTKRFAYSYIGTWHNKSESSKSESNSAVLSYGACSKYFR